MDDHKKFLQRAIQIAVESVENQGGPFGAVIVKNGEILAEGANEVTSSNDPTAHAEVQAIRKACANLKRYQLEDCIIYASCEPCPMCLGAIYWARPKAIYFAASKSEASDAGFDDSFIYEEIDKPYENRSIPTRQITTSGASTPFYRWNEAENKTLY